MRKIIYHIKSTCKKEAVSFSDTASYNSNNNLLIFKFYGKIVNC